MLFFKALSDLLNFVAYCFNVKDSVTKLFCICTIVILVGKIFMSFLCLCFVVRIDLLDVNGDVGGLRRR